MNDSTISVMIVATFTENLFAKLIDSSEDALVSLLLLITREDVEMEFPDIEFALVDSVEMEFELEDPLETELELEERPETELEIVEPSERIGTQHTHC